jgi:hypothetical protein
MLLVFTFPMRLETELWRVSLLRQNVTGMVGPDGNVAQLFHLFLKKVDLAAGLPQIQVIQAHLDTIAIPDLHFIQLC